MTKRLLLLALPFALLAAACGSDGGDMPADYAWQSTGIAGSDGSMSAPTTGTAPTLMFEDDNAAGNASCNQYGGSFELDGSSLTFGPLISTEMFCGDPGIMDQETAYLAALESVDSWTIDGETMTLSSNGAPVLTYAAISQDLAGTSWDLLAYNNGTGGFESAWGDEPVTAIFADDGTLSGSAGCNGYNATWEIDDGSIEIGPAASTKMMCGDEQIMIQETRYLELLGLAETYRVDAGALEMFDVDGTRILQYLVSTG
ncbi:MAG: META domain-containing protein [Actinomycetota bacterium]|nr:META domain-containing protein [Actinomycetota bacterium]